MFSLHIGQDVSPACNKLKWTQSTVTNQQLSKNWVYAFNSGGYKVGNFGKTLQEKHWKNDFCSSATFFNRPSPFQNVCIQRWSTIHDEQVEETYDDNNNNNSNIHNETSTKFKMY